MLPLTLVWMVKNQSEKFLIWQERNLLSGSYSHIPSVGLKMNCSITWLTLMNSVNFCLFWTRKWVVIYQIRSAVTCAHNGEVLPLWFEASHHRVDGGLLTRLFGERLCQCQDVLWRSWAFRPAVFVVMRAMLWVHSVVKGVFLTIVMCGR